jgi:hypothetical protein
MAEDVIPHIAERYRVSVEAARQVERALRGTGGRQAQFDHPDLGGRGQWQPGMVQIGRMFDEQLKGRVAGLCAEISAIVQGMETSADEALSRPAGTGAAGACAAVAAGESWWPAPFGHPAAEGQQHGVRYAYFPDRDRLLIQLGGQLCAYDTGGHRITGMSQQQQRHDAGRRTTSSLTFTDDRGEVRLEDLREVPVEEAIRGAAGA